MTEWLDTETKAMLQQVPPEKLAPPTTGLFTLVLLHKGKNTNRLVRALTRIPGISPGKAIDLSERQCPLPLVSGLSLGDVMLGQFELVCCDSISIFLRNEIVSSAEPHYLAQLYQQFRHSHEFEDVKVTIASVPETAMGERFVDQFLGGADIIPRLVTRGLHSYWGSMMRKKARIMSHWAQKIGVEIAVADSE
jgi:hypothetical protein